MLFSGPPHPGLVLAVASAFFFFFHFSPGSCCGGLGPPRLPLPHPVCDLIHSYISRYCANEKCTFLSPTLQPSPCLRLPYRHLSARHLVIKSNPIQLQWTFRSFLPNLFTCPRSVTSEQTSTLPAAQAYNLFSFSHHIFTLLVSPVDRLSAGVNQHNSTSSNGTIPIYKRWVSVLVPPKANIFHLTSKNPQPGPSTSPAFITVISRPSVSQQSHSTIHTIPWNSYLALRSLLLTTQKFPFHSQISCTYTLPTLSHARLLMPSEYAWCNLVC